MVHLKDIFRLNKKCLGRIRNLTLSAIKAGPDLVHAYINIKKQYKNITYYIYIREIRNKIYKLCVVNIL